MFALSGGKVLPILRVMCFEFYNYVTFPEGESHHYKERCIISLKMR